jgi:glycosyltransferase involved in cell wall biosynthesis
MEQPKISVIIPAYNHEKFIGAALDSALNQTVSAVEIIVIDDGSTDNTAEIIKSYQDPRLTYIYQENQDAFNAINRGVEKAECQFITILNSDDVYTRNRLEKLINIQRDTGAECLFTDVIPIDENGNQIPKTQHYWHLWHERNRKFFFTYDDLYSVFLRGNLLVTTSNLFLTANAVKMIGKFAPLHFLHDYDYMFRALLALGNKVEYVHSEKLLYYRIHKSNTLSEGAVSARNQDKELIKKYMMARVPENIKPYVAAGSERLMELEYELGKLNNRFSPEAFCNLKHILLSRLEKILRK